MLLKVFSFLFPFAMTVDDLSLFHKLLLPVVSVGKKYNSNVLIPYVQKRKRLGQTEYSRRLIELTENKNYGNLVIKLFRFFESDYLS